jgi:hypothetical protein
MIDFIDKIKEKTTVGIQKAHNNTENGIARWECQAPKRTRGKQLGEQQR